MREAQCPEEEQPQLVQPAAAAAHAELMPCGLRAFSRKLIYFLERLSWKIQKTFFTPEVMTTRDDNRHQVIIT
jgi:hypothetical protein